MGKHGPCCHCGVTSTPLWRNGPPEKPVLCNACGSRWRTKGTLINYTPLHSRAEPDEFEDFRVSKVKTISIKNKEAKVFKRKFDQDISEYGLVPPDYNSGFRRGFDEDISNRSSSGSAISNSESCAQYGNADASDLTGPSQPVVWDSMVPSRKRTCVTRPKPSPIEKLTQDLYKIWHQLQSSCISGFSDEDLLLETGKPMESVEIGHGSVLIRHPDSIAHEEESEASSLSINQKQKPFVNSRPMNFHVVMEDKGVNSLDRGIDKIKKPPNQGAEQERIRRDKDQLEKLQLLAHHNSPLCHIDLQEVLNIDKFANHLTYEEQKQLLKFLPSVDTVEAPLSLKSMFDSPQFDESILSFQKLLADGVLDNSFTGVSSEDCKLLKKLILCNSSRSKWVEQYNKLKDLKGKNSIDDSEVVGGFDSFATDNSSTIKRLRDGQHQKSAGSKVVMKSPRKIIMKSSYDQKELTDKNALFLTSKSIVSSQNDNGPSLAFGYSQHYGAESCDQDLLLDVPSNSSFPQAELLRPFPSFGAEASTSSSSVYPDTVRP